MLSPLLESRVDRSGDIAPVERYDSAAAWFDTVGRVWTEGFTPQVLRLRKGRPGNGACQDVARTLHPGLGH
jgi:hypothetical protein